MKEETRDWLTLAFIVAVCLAVLYMTWGCRSLLTPTIEYSGSPSLPVVEVPTEADTWKLAITGGAATLAALLIRWVDHRFRDK